MLLCHWTCQAGDMNYWIKILFVTDYRSFCSYMPPNPLLVLQIYDSPSEQASHNHHNYQANPYFLASKDYSLENQRKQTMPGG